VNIISFLNILLPFGYAVAVYAYGKAFFADTPWAKSSKRWILLSVIGTHGVYLAARTTAFSHPPATTVYEVLTLLAFTTSAAYYVIESRTGNRETGYFILNIPFFFQLVSSLFIKDLLEVPEILRSNYFGFHVTAALAGYSAITLSAVYGFLYLMLYHEIKQTRFGAVYRKLPSLENLERMSVMAIWLAFFFLAAAMLAGVVWLPQAFSDFSYADPKLIGTVFIWLLYGAALAARRSTRWKGRKMMIVAISGFVISIFSLTAVNMLLSGFHRFN